MKVRLWIWSRVDSVFFAVWDMACSGAWQRVITHRIMAAHNEKIFYPLIYLYICIGKNFFYTLTHTGNHGLSLPMDLRMFAISKVHVSIYQTPISTKELQTNNKLIKQTSHTNT